MRRAGRSACLRRGLAIVALLSLSLFVYEFSVVRLYHTSITCVQQVYPIIHCHTKLSPPTLVKSNPNVIHISYHDPSHSSVIQESSHNLSKDNLPRRNLRQEEQSNSPSDPPKNRPHNASEKYVHSIHTKSDESNGMAETVSSNYHVEQKDSVHMPQGQYAQDNFKYVDFGDRNKLAKGRKIIQSQTEVAGHSDHIRASSIQNNGGPMPPGGRADQAVPSRPQQRPQLKTTGLSRQRLSMAIMQISEQLLQLRGFPVPANKDLVTGRHFPLWKTSSEITSRLEYLHQVVDGVELTWRNLTQYSLNEDIGARGKFQQAKMQQFCRKHNISNRLPYTAADLNDLFQHLLYDDEKRLVYCYVPKAGSGNMKRMMIILNGIVRPKERYPKEQLKQIHSFRNLSTSEALYKLNNYYKFAIVRNPMERMLSAYRNKLEMPYNHSNHHFPDKLQGYILRQYRRAEFWKWVEQGNQSVDIHPTFSEFLQFMLRYPPTYYNEHFKPVLNLCFPCAIHYDFYANFKSQDYDVYALLDYLGIPSTYYPHTILHKGTPTEVYLQDYYQALPTALKAKIVRTLRTELEFYYTLYPEERNMHVLL